MKLYLLAICLLFQDILAAPSGQGNTTANVSPYFDNALLTCLTNPCVDVNGVGKILGTKKVTN